MTIHGDTASNDGTTATPGTDYHFTLPEVSASEAEAGLSYQLTSVTIGGADYNGCLSDGNAYTIPGADITGDIVITITKSGNEYVLTSLTLWNSAGDTIFDIPNSAFWVTVGVKKLSVNGNSVVLVTTYDENGQYIGMHSAWLADVPTDSTVNVGFLLNNADEKIAEIRAFCVASLGSPIPLGEPLSVRRS